MEQCVMISGTMKMLLLSAHNLDSLTMVSTWVTSVVILSPFYHNKSSDQCKYIRAFKSCFYCDNFYSNMKSSVCLQEP